MIETYIRPAYNRLFVEPIAQLLKSTFIHSNFITLLAAISGVVAMLCLLWQQTWWAVALLLVSGYLDTLDGTLARIRGAQNARGCVFDIVSDRIVELAIVYGLYQIDPTQRGLACFWILGSFYLCITAFLAVGIFVQNQGDKGFQYSVGLIERAEVFGFFIAMILLPNWFNLLAALLTGLVFLTSFIHIYQFAKIKR